MAQQQGAPQGGTPGAAAPVNLRPKQQKQQQRQQQRQQQQQQKKAGAAAGGGGAGGGGKAAGAPGQPAAAPAPAPPKVPKAKPLTPQQQKQLAKAQTGGYEAQYLKNHPGVAKHQTKVAAANKAAAQPGSSPAAPTPPAPGGGQPKPPPAPGNPPPTAGGDGGGGAAPPAAAPTFQEGLESVAGANNPFGLQSWYGDNPLETAKAASEQELGKSLADVRARYAGSGFGNSAREALAEGTAVAQNKVQLGDALARLGTQVKSDDLTRLANIVMTGRQQALSNKQLGLEANQQLANLGTGLLGLEEQEQEIPNLGNIVALLTNFGNVSGLGRGRALPGRK